MFKRMVSLLLVLSLCFALGIGLAEEKVELTFWPHSGSEEVLAPFIAEFQEAHPEIELTVSYYGTDDLKEALKIAASSETLPDIWFNWGGSLAGYYTENMLTYDLTAYAEENGWADKFSASALDLCRLYGQLAGYPIALNTMTLYYNKPVFERCGVTVPKTFEELEQVCETLKDNGVVPFSTAGLYGWHVMRIVEQLVEYYAGAELHDQLQLMTASWDCEAVIKALAKYQEWAQKGYFPEGFVTNSPDDTLMLLVTEYAAMFPETQAFDRTITNEELSVDNFGMFPFPNNTGRISAFADMIQFNAKLTDAQLKAAMEFLDYIYNGTRADINTLQSSVIPETEPHAQEIFDYSKTSGSFTITDQAFPTQVADVLFRQQDALALGTTTPEAAAAAIEAAVQVYKSGK